MARIYSFEITRTSLMIGLVLGILVLSGCVETTSPPANNNTTTPTIPVTEPADTVAPTLYVLSSPEKVYVGEELTITVTATDNRALQEIRVTYFSNEETKTITCNASPCTVKVEAVPVGGVDYGVVALDTAGNESRYPTDATSTHVFVESGVRYNDLIAPRVSVTQEPASPHVNDTITLVAFTNDVSGINSMEIFMDGVSIKSCAFNASKVANCIVSTSFASAGEHSYYAKATDSFGNVGESTPETLNVLI